MNINQIITAVQRLHQKTSLTSDERASILQGLNDARAFAEREHDFHALMNFGYALVDPTDGGRFDAVSLVSTSAPYVSVWDPAVTYLPYTDYDYLFHVRAADGTVWLPTRESTEMDPSLRITWAVGLSLVSGDLVVHNDVIYYCDVNHTSASLTEPGVGADWTTVYDDVGGGFWSLVDESVMRDVHLAEWWDENLEVWVPMDLVDAKTLRARWDTQNALDNAQSFAQPTLVIYGNGVIRIFGVEEEHDPYLVRLYGPFWLDEYVDVAGSCTQEDFLTQHGHDFLMWSAALDINMVFMTWIPRQEGAMPPPESRRERAWQSLLDWDNFQHLPRQQNYVK